MSALSSLKNLSAEEVERLATLSVVSKLLCEDEPKSEVLPQVLATISSAFEADRGFIRTLGDEQQVESEFYLDVRADPPNVEFQFTSTLLQNCLTTLEPVFVIDSQEMVSTESVVVEGIRSVMLHPIIFEGKLLAVIYLDSVIRAGCFEKNDLKLLGVMCEMMAVALDRDHQVKTVQRQSMELVDVRLQLEVAAEETISRLSRAAEFRDGETSEHLSRVSLYCEAVARHLGLPESDVASIKVASLLHDVGKVGIPDSIMLKPGRFTAYERQVMNKHTEYGAQILANSDSPIIQLAEQIALSHHEKWDGSGYPHGLKGEAIPIAARIVAAADVFDAVSSARRYKASYSLEHTFELLQKESGSHFDPSVAQAFFDIQDEIKRIWTENQEQDEEVLEKPIAPPKVEPQVKGKDALFETLESIPVLLATNSCLTEQERVGAIQAFEQLVQKLSPHCRAEGQEYFRAARLLLERESLSFHDATSLAQSFSKFQSFWERSAALEKGVKRRVMVIDGDPYQREVLSTEALSRNVEVKEYSAFEAAWNDLQKEPPDLVLFEVDDPGGEEFLVKVRTLSAHLPMVILSRNGELNRRLEVSKHKHTAYLRKPLPPSAVFDEILERLPAANSSAELKILALDDDPVVLVVLKRSLSKLGFKVKTVQDPREFWSVLNTTAPDLVILDLEMPTVSGLDICQVLRSDLEYHHLPIVVLTGHSDAEYYQKALEAGADDVLSKPLEVDRIVTRIRSRLNRNRALQLSGSRDPLTGFQDSRSARKTARQLFAIAVRADVPFCVGLIEIEDFDGLIKSNGSLQAYEFLRRVAEMLERNARPEDIITRVLENRLLVMLHGISTDGGAQRLESLNTRLSQQKSAVSSIRCLGRFASSPKDGTELNKLFRHVGLDLEQV